MEHRALTADDCAIMKVRYSIDERIGKFIISTRPVASPANKKEGKLWRCHDFSSQDLLDVY